MTEPRNRATTTGSGLLLSALGGAVVGAAGLGWWLLSEADRRRRQRPFQTLLRADEQRPLFTEPLAMPQRLRSRGAAEPALQERVQQLNQAIDEVRRQLEALQPQP